MKILILLAQCIQFHSGSFVWRLSMKGRPSISAQSSSVETEGDNGLSGKKLLMDYYGPRVPTGGSALFGKDAFKPDRVNAMRARELALSEVRAKNVKEATVTIVYFPGMISGEITRIEVQQ